MSYSVYITRHDLTIASGGTTSPALDLAALGEQVVGIVTPATLTSTTITFTCCATGTTFVPLYDSTGTQVSVTVGTSRFIYLSPAIFAGVAQLKLVGGSSEGGDRVISVLTRPV
jgi:hypothetical protein